MEKRWSVKSSVDGVVVDQLASELGIDKVLANLLVQRRIVNYEEAKKFFRPSLDDLHDPF